MAIRKEIVIPVKLDEKTFRRFARFDMLQLRRMWVRPAVFALIFCAFAFVALWSRLPQSGLIAAVLLVVGLGLPIVYIGMFLSQVNVEAEKRKLGKGKHVYTVVLRNQDFTVVSNQKDSEAVTVAWKDAAQAFRMRGCIYLYATPTKAFLLPNGQSNATDDAVWETIVHCLGANKCRVSRFGVR
ncbi:MAG: hypothetical protein IJ719_19800 [Clostridia bacterium]|nr:hypothetical protein [Clostridia bacterium]